MNKVTMWGLAAAGMAICGPANAAQYLFAMSGNVSSIFNYEARPDGSIVVIDDLTEISLGTHVDVTAVFDTRDFLRAPPRVMAPTIYEGTFKSIAYHIGGYDYAKDAASQEMAQILIQNDFFGIFDSWSLFGAIVVSGQPLPSDVKPGKVLVGFNYQATDVTGQARSDDLLEDEIDLSAYPLRTGSVSFFNSDLNRETLYFLGDLRASFTPISAVPEPASWALMLAGFGATGFAMRRRKAVVAIA